MLASETKGISLQATAPAGLDRKEAELYLRLDPERLPKHIAIIMDGNGRWARKRHLPRGRASRRGHLRALRGRVRLADWYPLSDFVRVFRRKLETPSTHRSRLPDEAAFALSEAGGPDAAQKQCAPAIYRSAPRAAGVCPGKDGVGARGPVSQHGNALNPRAQLQRAVGDRGRLPITGTCRRQ